jgi:hypothetical protein
VGKHCENGVCVNDSGGGGGGNSGEDGDQAVPRSLVSLPEDLKPLRNFLGPFLQGIAGEHGQMYPGQLNVDYPGFWNQAINAGGQAQNLTNQWLGMGSNALGGLLNFNAPLNMGSFYNTYGDMLGLVQGAGNVYGNALPGLTGRLGPGYGALNSLAATGGAPDITSALAALENKAKLGIEDTLAGLREQYGGLGLGAGSDVNRALAEGAARGYADLASQQSMLTASIMNEAANRRLNAGLGLGSLAGTESGMYGTAAQIGLGGAGILGSALNPMLGAAGLPGQMAIQSANVRGQAASMLPQYAQTAAAPGMSMAQLLYQIGAGDISRQEGNINRGYNAWGYTQTYPYLNTATSYATGFPPSQYNPPQLPQQSGGGWWSAIGGLMGLLPFFL